MIKDATLHFGSVLPMFVIGKSSKCSLLMIYTSSSCSWTFDKKIWHMNWDKSCSNYFRYIMKDHANYVTTISSLDTESYLCFIIKTIYVQSQMRFLHLVNGSTCEFCLAHHLVSLDKPVDVYACQSCLRYESEVDISMWPEQMTISAPKENVDTNIWSHQYHFFTS